MTRVLVLSSVLLFFGAANAEPLAARCRGALKREHKDRFEASRPAPRFVDAEDGVSLDVTGANGYHAVWHCVAGTMRVPDGTLTLPAGWIAVDGAGVDSHVGTVLDASGKERLKYDIGAMAGTYAKSSDGNELLDAHEERVGPVRFRWGRRKGDVVMTLGETTNFWGPATDKTIAELLAISRSLKP